MDHTPTEEEQRKAIENGILKPAASAVVLTVGAALNCFGIGSFKKTWRFNKRYIWGAKPTAEELAEEEAAYRRKREAKAAKERERQEAERRKREISEEYRKRKELVEDSKPFREKLADKFHQGQTEIAELEKALADNPWWLKRVVLHRKVNKKAKALAGTHRALFCLEAKCCGRDVALVIAEEREDRVECLKRIKGTPLFQNAPTASEEVSKTLRLEYLFTTCLFPKKWGW